MDTMADKPSEESIQAKLETRIELLSQLNDRIKQLRNVPGLLLRQTNTPDILVFTDPITELQTDIGILKEVNEKIRSKDVQETLKDVAESEKTDSSGLLPHRSKRSKTSRPLYVHTSPNRKEYHPLIHNFSSEAPSPESPQTFPSFQPPTNQLLPSAESINDALTMDGLADFIHEYNKSNKNSLHIWTSTTRQREAALTSFPVTVRFTIPDVVTIFLSLGCAPTSTTIVVESATAFGPREKVSNIPVDKATYRYAASAHLVGFLVETATLSVRLCCLPKAVATTGKGHPFTATSSISAHPGSFT